MPVANRAADSGTGTAGPFWLPLCLLTTVVVALAAAGTLPVWPGLVHLVALPPLDLFGDFRILLTSASSWTWFAVLLTAVLAARITLLALMLGGLAPRRVAVAAAFYGVSAPLVLFAAQVSYMANTLLHARLFWSTLLGLALFFWLTASVPWQAAPERGPRWRDLPTRTWHSGFRAGTVLAYTAVVVGIGALAHLFPALTVPLVPASAAATALAARSLSGPPPPRALLRLGAAVAALTLLCSTWVLTRGGPPPEPAPPREGSIMMVSGISSRSGLGDMFDSRVDLLGYDCGQTYYFSYAGPGDGQPRRGSVCPVRTGAPFVGDHTQRPVDEQVAAFTEQVRDLPRPLVIAGHSHGAWIAWKAVATGAAPDVDALVLAGPFPESSGGYRPPGVPGPGQPASDLLHLLAPLSTLLGIEFDHEAPAAYALLGTTEAPAGIYGLPLPEGTRSLSVMSATDPPLMPSGWRMAVDRNACPLREPHPYIPTSNGYYEEVNRFLDREPAPDCPVFRDWGAPMTVPFGVPRTRMDPLEETERND